MDTKALIVLLVTIGLVLMANLIMFGMVRGLMRGDHRWMRSLTDALTKPTEKANQPYDELRQRVHDLTGETKKDE